MKEADLSPLLDPQLLYRGPRSVALRLVDHLESTGIAARLIDAGNPVVEWASRGTYAVDVYVSGRDLDVARKIAGRHFESSLADEAPSVERLRRGCPRDMAIGLVATAAAGAALVYVDVREPVLVTAIVIIVPITVGVLLSMRKET